MKFILYAFVTFASFNSHADWLLKWYSGAYTSSLSYNGQTAYVNERMGSNGSAAGPLGNYAERLATSFNNFKASLDGYVQNQVGTNGPLKILKTNLVGNAVFSIVGLTGAFTGESKLTISGLSYQVLLSYNSTWATCNGVISLNNIQMTTAFNYTTGAVDSSFNSVSLNPSSSLNCSSVLDWIPIFGPIVTGFLAESYSASVVAALNNYSTSMASTIVPVGSSLGGVLDAIPLQKYYINGTDMGAYLRNSFTQFFAGKTLTIIVGQPWPTGSIIYGVEDNPAWSLNNTYSLTFSDSTRSLNFSINGYRNWLYTWKCSIARPSLSCPPP